MAATSATIVNAGASPLALAAAPAPAPASPRQHVQLVPAQRLTVGRFNGLKISPALRQRAVVASPSPAAGARIFTICATAKPETLSTVQGIIAEQLQVNMEHVAPEAKFADLGADSLDTVEIIMALEEQFKIHLDEDGAQKIATVQDAADMIQNTITEAQSA